VSYKASANDTFTTYGLNAVRVDTFPDGRPAPPGFHYVVADTVPWGVDATVRFYWQGWDYDDPIIAADPGDIVGDEDTIKTKFQMSYTWQTNSLSNEFPLSANSDGRYPPGGSQGYPEVLEFNPFGEAGIDFGMNVMPVNYIVYGYSQDYFDRVDGTPATVTFTGGFASLVDSIRVGYLNSTLTVNLTALPPGDPVRILLHPSPVPYQGAQQVIWDPVGRVLTVRPNTVEAAYPFVNQFNLIFTFFGHDDPRNGSFAQLGRAFWDLQDSDFTNSSFQFVRDKFEPASDTTVKFWRPVFPGNPSPPAAGSYTVQLAITDDFFTISDANTPIYLGLKTFLGKFCNTIASQIVTEYIEDEAQRQLGLNNIGRVSKPLTAAVDIQYRPYTAPQ